MAEPDVPGDNPTPPVDPGAGNAPDPQPTPPNGSEPDNNPGPTNMVPSDRLREETEKRRKAEERIQELEAQQATPPSSNAEEVEIEPDTEKLLDTYVKKHGFVSKEELANDRMRIQVQQDVKDLEANPPNPGIAYNHTEVLDFAKTNNMPVTSKAALRAAYREMNYDKIVEATKQSAIDGYKSGDHSGAETPGSGGPTPPEEPTLTAKDPKGRTRERIRNARQKLQV